MPKRLFDFLRRFFAIGFCLILVAVSVVPAFAADNLNYSFDLIIPFDYVAVCAAVETNYSYMPFGLSTVSSSYGGSDQIYEANPNHPNGLPGWWMYDRQTFYDTNPCYNVQLALLSPRFGASDSYDVRFKSFDFVVKTDDLINRDQFYHMYGYDSLDQKPWWYVYGTVVLPSITDTGYELVEYKLNDHIQAKVPDLCDFVLTAIESVEPAVLSYDYIYFKDLEIRVCDEVPHSFFNNGNMLEGNLTGHAAGIWNDSQGVTRSNAVTVDLWFEQFDFKTSVPVIVQPTQIDLFGWLIEPIETFFQIEIAPNVSIGGICGILLAAMVLVAVLVMLKGR